MANPVRYFESVPYRRWVISFVDHGGRRRRVVRWSPGRPWVAEEFDREWGDSVRERSNVYFKQEDPR